MEERTAAARREEAAGEGARARLVTVQHRGAVRQLRHTGRLRGDGRRAPRDFLPAYAVMRQWLQAADPDYRGAPYPVWGWVLEGRGGERDALAEHLDNSKEYAGPAVALLARVDARRLVRSCFTCWHAVLNGFPLGEGDEALQRRWEAWMDATPPRRRGHPVDDAPAPLRRLLEQDWRRIVDRRCGCGPDGLTQGTVAQIRRDELAAVAPLGAGSDPRRVARRLLAVA